MDQVEELVLLVKAAQREGDRRVNEALRPLGLTGAQAEVLQVLDQAGPLSLGELGNLLVAEGGHPSRLVDRMVRAGHLSRGVSASDRRRLELSLTERGGALARQASRKKRTLLETSRSLLKGHDLGQIRALLEDYLADSAWRRTVQLRRGMSDRRDDAPS
jgi:MarR family transcriptional regulator, organic hydroperoxide resistance regulator